MWFWCDFQHEGLKARVNKCSRHKTLKRFWKLSVVVETSQSQMIVKIQATETSKAQTILKIRAEFRLSATSNAQKTLKIGVEQPNCKFSTTKLEIGLHFEMAKVQNWKGEIACRAGPTKTIYEKIASNLELAILFVRLASLEHLWTLQKDYPTHSLLKNKAVMCSSSWIWDWTQIRIIRTASATNLSR